MINIVLSTDDNYAQHAAVAMASILKHTSCPQDMRFFILDSGISEPKQKKLEQTAEAAHATLTFVPMKAIKLEGAFVSGHLSVAAYNRLLLAELLPITITRVIYLDVDLIVLDDLAKLWQTDLSGKPLGAVLDLGLMTSARTQRQKQESLDFDILQEGYFNSGVLLMDLGQWREAGYGKALLKLIAANSYRHHDQDALNKLFLHNWQVLPLRWNMIPPVSYLFAKILKSKKYRVMAIEANKNPAIIHFAGRTKPWEFPLTKGYNDLYYEYLALTPFAEAKMPQPSKDMKGKSAWRQQMRGKLAQLVLKRF